MDGTPLGVQHQVTSVHTSMTLERREGYLHRKKKGGKGEGMEGERRKGANFTINQDTELLTYALYIILNVKKIFASIFYTFSLT